MTTFDKNQLKLLADKEDEQDGSGFEEILGVQPGNTPPSDLARGEADEPGDCDGDSAEGTGSEPNFFGFTDHDQAEDAIRAGDERSDSIAPAPYLTPQAVEERRGIIRDSMLDGPLNFKTLMDTCRVPLHVLIKDVAFVEMELSTALDGLDGTAHQTMLIIHKQQLRSKIAETRKTLDDDKQGPLFTLENKMIQEEISLLKDTGYLKGDGKQKVGTVSAQDLDNMSLADLFDIALQFNNALARHGLQAAMQEHNEQIHASHGSR